MSKYVKDLFQGELEKKFDGVTDFMVLETKGVGGNDNNTMRGVLKEKGIHITVVKNAIMRRALDTLGMAAAASMFLSGPCTIAYGGESVVDVAKEVTAATKKLKVVVIKGAFVDGTVVDAEGAMALAKMPSRAELQGTIVRIAQTPGSNLAGAIAGPGGRIAGCIKTLVENLEEAA